MDLDLLGQVLAGLDRAVRITILTALDADGELVHAVRPGDLQLEVRGQTRDPQRDFLDL